MLPVANADDTEFACITAFPCITAAGNRASAVHIIEKADGALDETGAEQCEGVTDELFGVARRAAGDAGTGFHASPRFTTDAGNIILKTAAETDATATVFTLYSGRS